MYLECHLEIEITQKSGSPFSPSRAAWRITYIISHAALRDSFGFSFPGAARLIVNHLACEVIFCSEAIGCGQEISNTIVAF